MIEVVIDRMFGEPEDAGDLGTGLSGRRPAQALDLALRKRRAAALPHRADLGEAIVDMDRNHLQFHGHRHRQFDQRAHENDRAAATLGVVNREIACLEDAVLAQHRDVLGRRLRLAALAFPGVQRHLERRRRLAQAAHAGAEAQHRQAVIFVQQFRRHIGDDRARGQPLHVDRGDRADQKGLEAEDLRNPPHIADDIELGLKLCDLGREITAPGQICVSRPGGHRILHSRVPWHSSIIK
ncbi:hypothetical protein D9M72_524830 [compost metagenome]